MEPRGWAPGGGTLISGPLGCWWAPGRVTPFLANPAFFWHFFFSSFFLFLKKTIGFFLTFWKKKNGLQKKILARFFFSQKRRFPSLRGLTPGEGPSGVGTGPSLMDP